VPALTLPLIAVLDVHASVALGMLFVACCPSGNLSNLLTHRARGDVALSVSLTTVSNACAVVLTPLAFAFWGDLQPDVSGLMRDIDLDVADMAVEIALLIGLPFAAGALVAATWPAVAARARRPVEIGTLVLLLLLIAGSLAGSMTIFLDTIGAVALAVVLQNLLSLLVGYAAGRGCRLPVPGVRALTFELGIRNTALGLVIVLAYFDGLGGAAVLMAIWGLWDVIAGLTLASWWRRRRSQSDQSSRAATATSG
jgi:BASS family bile acid:Na+ symporter